MITVQFNEKKAKQFIDDIAQKQIPFATAKALTDTAARIGQIAAVKANSTMTIRKAWAGKFKSARIGAEPSPSAAFASKPAKKGPLRDMQSSVGTIGWQIKQQIDQQNSIREPLKAKALYIPLQVKRTKSQSASVLLRKLEAGGSPYFVQQTPKGLILFQRKGRDKIPLYKIVKDLAVKPVFNFLELAQVSANRYFGVFYVRAMKNAIRTAK